MKFEKFAQYFSIALLGALFFMLLGQVAVAFPSARWPMICVILLAIALCALGIAPSWVAMKVGKGEEFGRMDAWASLIPSGVAAVFVVVFALFGALAIGG